MRKLLLFLIVLAACHQPHITKDSGCDDERCALLASPEVRDILAQENWQFSVPGEGWVAMDPPAPETKVVTRNESKNCLIIFLKEGGQAKYADYVVGSIRGFVENGSTIVEIDQVEIHGNKYGKVHLVKASLNIWAWLTTKDGFGYGFTCGGEVDPTTKDNSLADLCQNVANTVEIK